ncbi:formylmethanofuran dehydrogenase subunit B [Halanaerobium sp. Z-7514]|uniref:Formylmethanofuran dehydrogenase subunit B n=1 Tax=Halanaerobium polyolivorans TaxID=2886943 RepID=A0AAW4WW95_9FIRM|nr:formylmethanofuran dehydrogenase subunit B [Halanaerobium polyolivorans]MCC3144101.1 formylmethanofuran dehydrogenase subunit B [Halanaerobium polyolivorans]RQD73314.1 MAG: formylmethanofuran dehydrogenase subunit B [Halanaerobium sp. MSAO_Bac5]
MTNVKEHKNITCTFCGALCDNIEVEVENNQIKKLRNVCAISRKKYEHALEDRTVPMINGQKSDYQSVITKAAEILKNSKNPLIYGLSSTTAEGQKNAVKLAELSGANIDSTSSVCHGPGTMAKQLVGMVTATLGEIKNRSDLMLFWGANPVEAHPNHSKRYSILAEGLFKKNRSEREIIAFDVRKTPTAKMADHYVELEPGKDFELLMALRLLINGKELNSEKDEIAGVKITEIKEIAEKLKNAKYGSIFYGMGLTMTGAKYMNTWAAMSLIRDLNSYGRFVMMPMRGHGNVAGSEITMAWQTGYPFAVNFSRAYPRYNPGEYTAVDLLANKEVDAAFIIASDPAANLPHQAAAFLKEIPTIVLDPHWNLTTDLADVIIPSAIKGITATGTVYRMDHVPLHLRSFLEDQWPDDAEAVSRIGELIENA